MQKSLQTFIEQRAAARTAIYAAAAELHAESILRFGKTEHSERGSKLGKLIADIPGIDEASKDAIAALVAEMAEVPIHRARKFIPPKGAFGSYTKVDSNRFTAAFIGDGKLICFKANNIGHSEIRDEFAAAWVPASIEEIKIFIMKLDDLHMDKLLGAFK